MTNIPIHHQPAEIPLLLRQTASVFIPTHWHAKPIRARVSLVTQICVKTDLFSGQAWWGDDCAVRHEVVEIIALPSDYRGDKAR